MALTPDRGTVRLLRGAVIGLIASLLGIGLHSAANGGTGAFGSFFAAMPVALVVGIALANRRYTFWRAWLVLLSLQPVIHLLATSTSHASHASATVDAGANARMLGAHLLAAALAAAWVAVGDRILWQWVGTWCRRLTLGERALIIARPRELLQETSRELVVTTERLLQSAPRRGPPSVVTVHAPCH